MSARKCEDCLEFLLAAEPAQLQGPHEWREHLRECPLCGARARAILAGTEELGEALAVLTRQPVPAAAPARLPARRRLGRWPSVAALLAAAAALVLVVVRPGARAPAVLPPLAGPAVRVPAMPEVNGAGGSGVAVMRTGNPDIVVVWTY